jgi:methylated-DNA-[protein]-cysteine S-methyltransferase
MPIDYTLFDSAIGTCGLAWSAHGIVRLQLPEADTQTTERRLRAIDGVEAIQPLPEWVEHAIDEVRRYAAGEPVAFAQVRLDSSAVGDFEGRVYAATRAVAWGRTATYGDLARTLGAPGAAQAVGRALSRNPIAIIIPCHRILASGNKSGGFSAFGGVSAKRRLLALEGVQIGEQTPLLPGLLPAGH